MYSTTCRRNVRSDVCDRQKRHVHVHVHVLCPCPLSMAMSMSMSQCDVCVAEDACALILCSNTTIWRSPAHILNSAILLPWAPHNSALEPIARCDRRRLGKRFVRVARGAYERHPMQPTALQAVPREKFGVDRTGTPATPWVAALDERLDGVGQPLRPQLTVDEELVVARINARRHPAAMRMKVARQVNGHILRTPRVVAHRPQSARSWLEAQGWAPSGA